MGRGEVLARRPFDLDVCAERVLALPADGLALAGGEGVQKALEVAIALVEEMELLVGALQEALGAQHLPFGLGQKGHMG